MNVARHSKRLFAALMASTITVVDVHAAVTDIYNQPLATTSTVVAKPNIMFILDNSGSMENAYMPDDMSDSGKYGYWSVQCNGVAFDPTYAYTPPVKADGTSYPDVSFSNALVDGLPTSATARCGRARIRARWAPVRRRSRWTPVALAATRSATWSRSATRPTARCA